MIGRINHHDKGNPMVPRVGFTFFSATLLAFVLTLSSCILSASCRYTKAAPHQAGA